MDLRRFADMLDQLEDHTPAPTSDCTEPTVMREPAATSDYAEPTMMVAPLQQKLELLKRATGVDSVYDAEEEPRDELDIMKQNAGLSTITVDALSDTEDSD
jgi:hypothetical protein